MNIDGVCFFDFDSFINYKRFKGKKKILKLELYF